MNPAQQITVAYDGSPQSEIAFHQALKMTRGLVVANVHVICVAEQVGEKVRLPTGEVLSHWAAREAIHHIIVGHAQQIVGGERLANVYVHLRTGDPAQLIVDLAYRFHADLILMGAGGRGGGAHIGRVAHDVLELSDIPVELQTAFTSSSQGRRFNALRFAYVFGGPDLRQENFSAAPRGEAASA